MSETDQQRAMERELRLRLRSAEKALTEAKETHRAAREALRKHLAEKRVTR